MNLRSIRLVVGLAMVVGGAYLALSPRVVADALDRPAATVSQMINLRASWGGTLLGLGAFVAWLPALRPWPRALLGLLAWSMAGIGLARLLGFALDGAPDRRQWMWILAEIGLVIASVVGPQRLARRR